MILQSSGEGNEITIQMYNGYMLNVIYSVQFSPVTQSCLFAIPWTAVCQASLSITNSRSLPKLMSIELVMPCYHLILCCPLLLPSIFPSIRVFSNESALCIGGQSIGVSASTSVLTIHCLINTRYVCSSFSHIWLFVTPWTVPCHTPLSIEFSRQE